jgi:hypothetical protein
MGHFLLEEIQASAPRGRSVVLAGESTLNALDYVLHGHGKLPLHCRAIFDILYEQVVQIAGNFATIVIDLIYFTNWKSN